VFGTDYPTPDGTCIRDYIHVLDLADAHLKALDYLAAGGKSDIFNLGTGRGASVLEVLNAARRASGIDIPAKHVGRRAGDPVSVFADNRKARERLAWNPRFGLEEIVASAWKWQSGHPDGF
jgi:UDP-glucose 4-epimerase